MGHEINPDFKIGSMIAGVVNYPNSPYPEDALEAQETTRKSYFFPDVQARGYYPLYAKRFFKDNNIHLDIEDGDLEALKRGTYHLVITLQAMSLLTQELKLKRQQVTSPQPAPIMMEEQ